MIELRGKGLVAWRLQFLGTHLRGRLRRWWLLLRGGKPFCDFCNCRDCLYGDGIHLLQHAPTADGRWICDVCWCYDVCTAGSHHNGPCEDARGAPIVDCPHRPRLTGRFGT